MNTIFQVLGLVVACALALLAIRVFHLKPALGLLCTLLVAAMAWEFPQLPRLFGLAGASVYFEDIVASLFLCYGLWRWRTIANNIGKIAYLWFLMGAMLGVSLFVGISNFGLGLAFTEFRLYFHPFATLTWALALQWPRQLRPRTWARFSLTAGWALVGVAIYHLAIYGLGGATEYVFVNDDDLQTARPLVSGQALALLMTAAVCLWWWNKTRKTTYLLSTCAFFIIVLVVQQRTVWGVGIAGIIAIVLIGNVRIKAAIAALALVGGTVAYAFFKQGALEKFIATLISAASDSRTYDARVQSWVALIDQSITRGPETIAFGMGMGAGFGRFEGEGRWVEFAPHNWYLTLYLRIGLIGLSLFMFFILWILGREIVIKGSAAAIVIFVMMLVYGWSYSWLWYVMPFLGWAALYGGSQAQRRSLPNATDSNWALAAAEPSIGRIDK